MILGKELKYQAFSTVPTLEEGVVYGTLEIAEEYKVVPGQKMKDLVTWEAEDFDGAIASFEAAVEDYLEMCFELRRKK